MTNHFFHPSILRAYDIRGIYNQTLFDIDAYYVARCIAKILHNQSKNKIVVGYDGRNSSPALKKHLLKGLIESGLEIIDIGICPTPMLYFSVYDLNFDAGIMITGSHNPKDHNGFKIMIKDQNYFGDDIDNLANILANKDFINGNGKLTENNTSNRYIERLLFDSILSLNQSKIGQNIKKLKIVWDCGNGSSGDIVTQLTKKIYGEHILLFNNIDGNFPNHHPDPTEEKNLQDLIKFVKENNCDLGIAFDGDGDRIGVVANNGSIIWGDQLMVLLARDVLKHNPQATIIGDVKASKVLFDEISKANGNAIMWKTGHSLIKAKMRETKAKLAGEMSGHIFFADKYYGFDDGIYSAIRLLNIVAESDISLANFKQNLPKTYTTTEIKINTSDENKFKIIENIKQNLHKNHQKFIDIDGIRCDSDIGWWLIRASNTQPVLVARCEANSIENLNLLKENVKNNLKIFSLELPKEFE
jgi:phosphomannomutase